MKRNDLTKYKVKATPQEKEMLDRLLSLGFMNEAEVLRIGLRLLYKEEFEKKKSVYVKKKDRDPKEEEMTEEKCIETNGEIVVEAGIKKCMIQNGAMVEYFVIK